MTRILVAVDESDVSTAALRWTVDKAFKEGDSLYIVTVLPPVNYALAPVYPVATASAVAAVTSQWEAQKKHDEALATELLRHAAQLALHAGVPADAVHAHALPAAGGASGVAESVVEFARTKAVELVVAGSRGMGAVKSSLMALVGLGSVSDYLLNHLECAVAVVRSKEGKADTAAAPARAPKTVCVAFDDSPQAGHALTWALGHLVGASDSVHLLVVAAPVPYPILDETSAEVAAMESQQWAQRQGAARAGAAALAARAEAAARAAGVAEPRLVSGVVEPEGGASDVGASICKYAEKEQVDLLVLGSRGMGAFRQSLASFVGLGSVSAYCVHHLHLPVLVAKAPEAALEAEAEARIAAAAAAAATAPAAPAAPAAVDAKVGGKQD